ncbi:Bacterial hemoglobin [Colletotrichum orbiculare MAFF 240422]|uniref:Bacterial hemoglobin n=1 Tax=Colletotrichum orbiculare (strain 104-T / ATCC 96160 / CBS 514.97 / LARS 414 / MAFF 240422) TaxID=1213857 RepID=A0A484G5M2_COLOR|nr:Bacterial hemoglobin [Colletotrichum orbiculare MAFF 240422]
MAAEAADASVAHDSHPSPASARHEIEAVSAEKMAIIHATAPLLKENAMTITMSFYHSMKDVYPELVAKFARQPRQLSTAILAYCQLLDDPPKLMRGVERIAQIHVDAEITPDLYRLVGAGFVEAVGKVLGDEATDEVLGAWDDAFRVLSDVLIAREKQIYAQAQVTKSVGEN